MSIKIIKNVDDMPRFVKRYRLSKNINGDLEIEYSTVTDSEDFGYKDMAYTKEELIERLNELGKNPTDKLVKKCRKISKKISKKIKKLKKIEHTRFETLLGLLLRQNVTSFEIKMVEGRYQYVRRCNNRFNLDCKTVMEDVFRDNPELTHRLDSSAFHYYVENLKLIQNQMSEITDMVKISPLAESTVSILIPLIESGEYGIHVHKENDILENTISANSVKNITFNVKKGKMWVTVKTHIRCDKDGSDIKFTPLLDDSIFEFFSRNNLEIKWDTEEISGLSPLSFSFQVTEDFYST